MKTILLFLIAMCSSVFINGQSIIDIPDQYTETTIYDSLNIDQYVQGVECYDVNYIPTIPHPNAQPGHPIITDTELHDARENMTVTMKINYAGFNMGLHPDDELWVYNDHDSLVEINTSYEDPFNPGEHLFFLNVRGNFDTYNTRLIYYSGTYDCTIEYTSVFEYRHNMVLGSPLEPFVIDMAPIIFNISDNFISGEIVADDYQGDFCLEITVHDCNGDSIGTEEVCYKLGTAPCVDNLYISQEQIDQVTNHTFSARNTISSSAVIDHQKNINYTAAECTTLLSGFEVVLGSQLLVESVGCP